MSLDKRTERELKEGIRFVSVQAAVDHFVEMLPLIRLSLQEMKRDPRCDPKLYQSTKGVEAMLADPEKLRARLETLKEPDGTLVFSFSPEAANHMRNLFKNESDAG